MQRPTDVAGMLILAVIAAAVGIGTYALVRNEPWAAGGGRSSSSLKFDVSELIQVDPSLVHFRQTAEFPVGLQRVRAIAAGPDERIYVAGDRAVRAFDPTGRRTATIELAGEPSCLAVAGDQSHAGRVYVGVAGGVAVFEAQGSPAGVWPAWRDGALLTSIAVSREAVFAADAAHRTILQFDLAGNLTRRIGEPESGASATSFIVPGPYFDVAVDEERLYAANPGACRIETFTLAGQRLSFWGVAGSAIDGFFGCCNPAHFTRLADGRFVTSEKGIPRIKVYGPEGGFESVVAGPAELQIGPAEIGDARAERARAIFDVAADQAGRVLVLDPRRRSVRIFTRITPVESTQ